MDHGPWNAHQELRQDNAKLRARIERLEQIILTMSGGSESSQPDVGEKHTHWVYPLIGSKDLVEEIKDSLSPSSTYEVLQAELDGMDLRKKGAVI